jgi:chromosome segregation ATPase
MSINFIEKVNSLNEELNKLKVEFQFKMNKIQSEIKQVDFAIAELNEEINKKNTLRLIIESQINKKQAYIEKKKLRFIFLSEYLQKQLELFKKSKKDIEEREKVMKDLVNTLKNHSQENLANDKSQYYVKKSDYTEFLKWKKRKKFFFF